MMLALHSESCKSHCNGGVKVALGGTFAALCLGEVELENYANRIVVESCKSHCNGGVKVASAGGFAALC